MKRKIKLNTVSIVAISMAVFATSDLALAQDNSQAEKQNPEKISEQIIVTGSRRLQRTVADTPSPVDVISSEEITKQAGTEVSDLVRNVVPSFNVNSQSINDAASIVRPANLRGLAPDQTLVLLNGRRINRSAVIAFIGGGIANGSQGTDIGRIPSIAIKKVEVLRDGAAAQYGSDAIAGVLNFTLKTSDDAYDADVKYGQYYAGDGATITVATNIGTALSENGFANLSLEYSKSDSTSRSVQRGDAAALIAAGNNAVPNPAQVWGSPEVKYNFKSMLNIGIDASETKNFYAFGGYSTKKTEGGFYYRNPNTRGGIYSNDGGVTRLVANLGLGSGHTCPVITIGAANEAALMAQVKADPLCFTFNEMFPGGFTPRFGGTVSDMFGAIGMKGSIGKLTYDLSMNTGRSHIEYRISNTINASLGPDSPTSFNPGSQTQTDQVVNADFNYPIKIEGLASDLNIAGGVEWRNETFELFAGDPLSYKAGSLITQGFSLGSNGFNGFNPIQAGRWSSQSHAAYIDAEADVTDKLVLGAAARFEHYNEFGDTTNFKISKFQDYIA